MRGAAHPRGHDRTRCRTAPPAPAEVLANAPAAEALQVAAVQDAVDHRRAVGLGVGEVAPRDHVARVPTGGTREVGAQTELAYVVELALSVQQAQRRDCQTLVQHLPCAGVGIAAAGSRRRTAGWRGRAGTADRRW